jgi:hypothetical protein
MPAPATHPSLLRDRGLWTVVLLTAAIRAALIAVAITFCWDQWWLKHLLVDVSNWGKFLLQSERGMIPYVEFSVEYPVGAGLLYWLLRPVIFLEDFRRAVIAHAAVMTAVDLLNAGLLYKLIRDVRPDRARVLTLLFTLSFTALVLSPPRFDSIVVLFVLLGLLAHRQDRPLWATLFWSLGALVKWYPAVLIAVQELRALRVEGRKGQWLRSGLIFAGVTIAVNAPFVILSYALRGNLDAWAYPYRFHMQRPLYWDTLLGVGQLWLGPLSFEKYASLVSLVLLAAVLLARPAMSLEYKATLACIAGLVVNRVYSPQFHLWFYPLLLLGMAQEVGPAFRRLLATYVTLDVLNVIVYPITFAHTMLEVQTKPYAARLTGGLWTVLFSATIVVRTFCLIALARALFRSAVAERAGSLEATPASVVGAAAAGCAPPDPSSATAPRP